MTEQEIRDQFPEAIPKLRQFLTHLRFDPEQLARRARPVTFIDIVYHGRTFEFLITLLHSWCLETGSDWRAVRRKIRIIGMTERQKTSPKTWRWQQQSDWVNLLEPNAIKNVSTPALFWRYLGDYESKMSVQFVPARWSDPKVKLPKYDRDTLRALRNAVSLFDAGREKPARLRFARQLARQPAMEHAWFRDLMLELKK
jgi:hypothetical protein